LTSVNNALLDGTFDLRGYALCVRDALRKELVRIAALARYSTPPQVGAFNQERAV
jgi:hypothetical protein